ncbi:MAG TPA: hypothetical protein GXX63_09515 [Tissierellia bacterium]|nr:hypothetical protein [Tissierellia bacterium]
MIKFKHKEDGSVFYAKPDTIQYRILESDSNYEVVEEKKVTKNKAAKK